MAVRRINNYAEIVFTCSEAVHQNSELVAEEHSVVRVLSGQLKVIESNKAYFFEAGETFLFPKNRLARLVKTGKDGLPYRAIIVKLTQDVLKAFYEHKKIDAVTVFKSDAIIPLSKGPLLDSFFASMLPYFDLEYKLPRELSELKIQEAIAILRAIKSNMDHILSDFSEPHKINLVEFMERNYMFNMPIEKFSYLTGRSLTTFKRDFKKVYGTTPQKWLTLKRLELARYQLAEKNRKPSEIYLESGFENLSHFSYAFKKQFGFTPSKLSKAK